MISKEYAFNSDSTLYHSGDIINITVDNIFQNMITDMYILELKAKEVFNLSTENYTDHWNDATLGNSPDMVDKLKKLI
jgi:hypothetical protein